MTRAMRRLLLEEHQRMVRLDRPKESDRTQSQHQRSTNQREAP